MVEAEILAYYEHNGERDRLASGGQRIEFLRVRDLLERFLPPPSATVLDVGGGAGRYAIPLAAEGYEVHPVPLLVSQAAEVAQAAAIPLASALVGDALARRRRRQRGRGPAARPALPPDQQRRPLDQQGRFAACRSC